MRHEDKPALDFNLKVTEYPYSSWNTDVSFITAPSKSDSRSGSEEARGPTQPSEAVIAFWGDRVLGFRSAPGPQAHRPLTSLPGGEGL